jgi:hypothetical protein
MTKFLTYVQIVAVAIQGGPEIWKLLPEKYHPLWHFAVSLIQGLAAYAQRSYNPDGTLAEAPYTRRVPTPARDSIGLRQESDL